MDFNSSIVNTLVMDELKSSVLIITVLLAIFTSLSVLGMNREPRVVFQTGTLDSTVKVEVADNQTERAKGLMNREKLCADCGMLFVYQDSAQRAFWMKNTSIPLDIIFISEEQEVLNIEEADPEPGVSDSNLTRYYSEGPAKYVVEVNQGYSERKSIEGGTKVLFRSIPLDQ